MATNILPTSHPVLLEEHAPREAIEDRITRSPNGNPKVTVIVPKPTIRASTDGDPHCSGLEKRCATPGDAMAKSHQSGAWRHDNANQKPVTTFNPPIELRVTITDDHQRGPKKDKRPEAGLLPKRRTVDTLYGVSLSDQGDELVVAISTWYADPGIGTW